MTAQRLLTSPSWQIMFALLAGVAAGALAPEQAVALRFIGDVFVDAVKLFVGPIIFLTVTLAIASLRGPELGAAGLKAFVYFETLSLLSLLAGVAGGWLFQPGSAPGQAAAALPGWNGQPPSVPLAEVLSHTLTRSVALPLLLAGVACGLVLARRPALHARLAPRLGALSHTLFALVRLLLKAAPLAAFASIAFIVGKYGLPSLTPLLKLLGALYATTIAFVVLVLGGVAAACGAPPWRLLVYLRDELLLVFGTAASVASIPPLIDKLTRLGCPGALVQVLLPAGFSFNLNGSSIYLTLTLLFLAQVSQAALSPLQLAYIVGVAMIASKGASGIAGSSFVVLGSLALLVPGIAPESLVLVFSLERLLKCRSLANVIGNAVACIAVLRWMGKLDRAALRAALGTAGPAA